MALQLVENRLTLMASLAIQGAEAATVCGHFRGLDQVQVMGEEGGNEWSSPQSKLATPSVSA